MGENQHKNIGDEIKDIVQDAIGNNNFQHLNEDISNTINSALYEVRNAVDDIKREFTNSSYRGRDKVNHMKNRVNSINKDVILDATRHDKERNVYRQNNRSNHRDRMNQSSHSSSSSSSYSTSNSQSHNGQYNRGNTQRYHSTSRNNTREMTASKEYQKNNLEKVRLNPSVGQVASILYTVFGSIFGLGFGVCTLVFYSITSTGFGAAVHSILTAVFGVGFLIFLLMFHRGNVLRKRMKRFKRYITIINGRNYCTMTELGDRTGFGRRFVIKDVKNMIKAGMFVEGNIDEKGTCLMLNQEAYDMYVQATNNLALREKEQVKQVEAPSEKEDFGKNHSQEVLDVLKEGKDYIQNIKLANDFIDDVDVSLKLDRMEQVTKKIFEYIENHPEKIKEIRRFMDYYLPTTMKLLNAYKKFDEELIQGDNIKNSKLEISRTLDTINNAFENLLDDLYEDEAMDISTDISVLETILMQEGLTEQKMKSK